MKFITPLKDFATKNKGLIGLLLIVLLIVFLVYAVVFIMNPSIEFATGMNLFFTPFITVLGFFLVLINLKGIKDSNKAILSQPVYDDLKEEIKVLEKKAHERIIGDSDRTFYDKDFSDTYSATTFYRCGPVVLIILKHYSENPFYINLQDSIKNHIYRIPHGNLESTKSFVGMFSNVLFLFLMIGSFFKTIASKYKEIYDCKHLLKEQKEQLFQNLDELCNDYFTINEAIKSGNDNLYRFSNTKAILRLPMILVDNNNLLSERGSLLNEDFTRAYTYIQELKEKLSKE